LITSPADRQAIAVRGAARGKADARNHLLRPIRSPHDVWSFGDRTIARPSPAFRAAVSRYAFCVGGGGVRKAGGRRLVDRGGSDGAHGLVTIKEQGGVSIVQRPSEAADPTMPLTGIREDTVDYVTSLNELPGLLLSLAEGTSVRQRKDKAGWIAPQRERENAWNSPPTRRSQNFSK